MSDPNEPIQWGRPLKRRSKGPKPQTAGGPEAPVVGPIDHPIDPAAAGTIVRSTTPRPAVPMSGSRREPGEEDEKLRDLVGFVARGLVDRPDDVSVEYLTVTTAETSLELRVHPDDLGHVIGKLGRTARSVRLTLGAAAQKLGRRANLEIAD